MPKYMEKSGEVKQVKMSYPQGDEMTKSVIPSSIKPIKKVNYTHKEGK